MTILHSFGRTLRNAVLLLAIGAVTAPVCLSAVPGLPFTEDFATADLKDGSNTTVNWSTTEQQVYLAWSKAYTGAFSSSTAANEIFAADTTPSLAIAIGDMNGDGLLDIVIGNQTIDRLYLNNGDGTFAASNASNQSEYTNALALGDVDGDGDLDVVAGTAAQNRLYINDGSGTFALITIAPADTVPTRAVKLFDADGDGDLDLVAGNVNAVNRLYFNNGSGTFDAGRDITTDDTTDTTNALAVGYVNDDAYLDIVAGNTATNGLTNAVNVLYLSNGDGTFSRSTFGSSQKTKAIAVGDMNGDGLIDVVTGNYGQYNNLYLNNGTADPFLNVTGSPIDTNAYSTWGITVADMDSDGDLDVITAENTNGVPNQFYPNNGTATPFGSGIAGTAVGNNAAATNSTGVATADLDGDGKLDLAFAKSGSNHFYLNGGTVVTGAAPLFYGGKDIGSAGTTSDIVAIGDVNDDGFPDVVVGRAGAANQLYLNNGTPDSFTGVTGINITDEADTTKSLVLGDVNGDTYLDVVVGNAQGLKFYLNAMGSGTGTAANPFNGLTTGSIIGTTTQVNANSVALGDVDQDGDLDLVVASGVSGADNTSFVELYLNSGSLTAPFSALSNSTVIEDNGAGSSSRQNLLSTVALGDLDGNGSLDLVLGTSFQNFIYYSNCSTNCTAGSNPISYTFTDIDTGNGVDTRSVAVADVDGDGDLDIVFGNYASANRVYLNNGSSTPTFTGSDITSDVSATTSIALGDLDGDGLLDVVEGRSGWVSFIYMNTGGVTPFTNAGIQLGTAGKSPSVAVGDMNGDGLLDVVTGNEAIYAAQFFRQKFSATYRTDRGAVRSLTIDSETADIANATLTATSSEPVGTGIDWYLSSNGGTKWFQVTPNTPFVFPASSRGSDLRWRAKLASQSPVLTPVISSVTVTTDTTSPTATLGYSAGLYQLGDTVTITANFDEDIASSPAMQISVSAPTGGNPVGPVDMSRVSATQYTYLYTVGNGSGTVNVSLTNGTDLVGNPVDTVPYNGSFTISKTDQTISGLTATPSSGFVYNDGQTAFLSGASSNIVGLTPYYAIDSVTATHCNLDVDGQTVHFTAAGTCTVMAKEDGNDTYNAGSQPLDINVAMADQTINSFTAPPSGTVGGSYTLTATGGNSGNPVTFGTTSADTICTVDSATGLVSYTGAGTCSVMADQAGDANYNPATQVTSDIDVNSDQTIDSFTAPSSGTAGGTGTLSAAASSGLAVTFGSATTGICTVSGTTVSYKTAGTCTVTADQAGDANYNAAPQVTSDITVNAASGGNSGSSGGGGGGGAFGWLSLFAGLLLLRRRG